MDIAQTLGLIPSLPARPARRPGNPDLNTALGLTSFGVRFDVSANEVDLLRDALLYLPPECKRSFSASISPQFSLIRSERSSASRESTYCLYRNRRLLYKCRDRDQLLERFRSIVARYVAGASRRCTFVRAVVVGWGNSAVLITGRVSGMTGLVGELIRAGATYYSNEFAVVDKRGMVCPYALPFRIGDSSFCAHPHRAVESLHASTGYDPIPVALVLISRYKVEARWRPRRLSPALGLAKVLDNTVASRRAKTAALDTLSQVMSNAVIVAGVCGEASQMVAWIAGHFDSAHGKSPQSEFLPARSWRTGTAQGPLNSQ